MMFKKHAMNTMKTLALLTTSLGLTLTTRVVPANAQLNVNVNLPGAQPQPIYLIPPQPQIQYVPPQPYFHHSSPRSKHNRARYARPPVQYIYPQSRSGVTISF
ncbi:hypothetical protein Syn6312_2485 [Synechococcus sp. PCC 6312]|nr:hypothetical protein Syn6312_2485 [Synechococcus sp. PCC 6312]